MWDNRMLRRIVTYRLSYIPRIGTYSRVHAGSTGTIRGVIRRDRTRDCGS